MSKQIVDALNAKYMASKLQAIANLQNYLSNPVGIGEHPDIVSECAKLLEQITDADGNLLTLRSMTESPEELKSDQ